MRAALRMYEAMQSWTWAAVAASNLNQTELVVGDVDAAKVTAKKSVTLADCAGNALQKIHNLTTYADALHAAGELKKARVYSPTPRAGRESGSRNSHYCMAFQDIVIGIYY